MKSFFLFENLVKCLSKLFLESSDYWNETESIEKLENLSKLEEMKSRGGSGGGGGGGCLVTGRNHGRHGTWSSRPKRRHPSSLRREVKVGDFKESNNGKRRENYGKGENNRECRSGIGIYGLVALLSILSYLNSLHGDFVHDDLSAIKGNEDVSGQTAIGDIFLNDFWGKPMADPSSHKSYRPLTILTFRLNAWIHDLKPMGFHLVNIGLHAIVSLLFVRLCLRVVRMKATSALIAGLHFATHPIHTEAVSGIVGRADVLAAFFVLTSFLSYHRCQKEQNMETKYVYMSVILAFCAMLSKEHGVTVLGINVVWDLYLNRTIFFEYLTTGKRSSEARNLFKRLFIVGFGGFAFICFRILMLQGCLPQFSDQDNPASFAKSKLTRFRTFAYLPAFNFWLLLAPISLNYDWQMGSIPLIQKWSDSRNFLSFIFYTFIFFTIFHLLSKGKTRRDLVVGLTFLIIPFIPASNLLFRVGFVVAERVLYIPSLGFSLLLGVGAGRILSNQKSTTRVNLVKGFLVLGLCAFASKTWLRNEDWRSRESLFTSGLNLLPQNAKMHYNYANLQKDLGNTVKAIHHYREALRLWPHHASANNNLGTLLNDSTEAEAHFQEALRINPIHAHAFFNLANLKHQQGHTNFAIRLMERSLELEGNNPDALTNLAAMYADLGSNSKAKEIHLKILKLEPNSPDHLNNYAAFLQKIGLLEEALHFYQEALLRDANHTVALLNTARLIKKFNLHDNAESLYQRALLQNDDPQTKDGLGVLYLSTGRATKAEVLFTEALRILPNDPIVQVHLAQARLHLRKYDEAETLLLSVMEQTNSSQREALHQLSILYSHLNRTSDAFKYIKLAIRTCSETEITCVPIHAFHGDLSKDLEDLDSAILSYKRAVEMLLESKRCCLNQKYMIPASIVTHVHLNLGAIYHGQGKFKDAWIHYNEALAQDSSNSVLLQNIEKLKRAEMQHKNNSSCHDKKGTSFLPRHQSLPSPSTR